MSGYQVSAITDCPHLHDVIQVVDTVAGSLETSASSATTTGISTGATTTAPVGGAGDTGLCLNCAECGVADEPWVCLVCERPGCSRYVSGHAATHARESSHHIALSTSDMSVWCYECESYIDTFNCAPLHSVFKKYYRLRFGEDPALPVIELGAASTTAGSSTTT